MKWWWSSDSSTPSTSAASISESTPSAADAPLRAKDGSSQEPAKKASVEEELSQYMPVFAQTPTPDTSSQRTSDSEQPTSIFSSTVYPTTMSCREAFDSAMHCRGPGGQFLHLYRYGEFRQCTEQWSQFWFCMRTRTQPKAIKEELIREFYREKDLKYENTPSSEDIWEERTERLTKAFDEDMSKVPKVILEDTREFRRQFQKTGGAVEAGQKASRDEAVVQTQAES
jgi:hypothetical protein